MITPEERDEIIATAVERALLVLPSVLLRLMANYDILSKVNKDFYSSNPGFQLHKDIVSSVVNEVEKENPLEDYGKLLNKSVPRIKERISIIRKVDTKTINYKPNLGLL